MVGLRLRRECVVALRLRDGVWVVWLCCSIWCLFCWLLVYLLVGFWFIVGCLFSRSDWLVSVAYWWFILGVLMNIALGGFGCICVWCCRLCYFVSVVCGFGRMLIVLCLVASFALYTFVWVLALIVCMWLLCLFGLDLRLALCVVCG